MTKEGTADQSRRPIRERITSAVNSARVFFGRVRNLIEEGEWPKNDRTFAELEAEFDGRTVTDNRSRTWTIKLNGVIKNVFSGGKHEWCPMVQVTLSCQSQDKKISSTLFLTPTNKFGGESTEQLGKDMFPLAMFERSKIEQLIENLGLIDDSQYDDNPEIVEFTMEGLYPKSHE